MVFQFIVTQRVDQIVDRPLHASIDRRPIDSEEHHRLTDFTQPERSFVAANPTYQSDRRYRVAHAFRARLQRPRLKPRSKCIGIRIFFD